MEIAFSPVYRRPGELEEDLRVMIGRFVDVCVRRYLKVNTDKMIMALARNERLISELIVDVAEFRDLGFILDESGT